MFGTFTRYRRVVKPFRCRVREFTSGTSMVSVPMFTLRCQPERCPRSFRSALLASIGCLLDACLVAFVKYRFVSASSAKEARAEAATPAAAARKSGAFSRAVLVGHARTPPSIVTGSWARKRCWRFPPPFHFTLFVSLETGERIAASAELDR